MNSRKLARLGLAFVLLAGLALLLNLKSRRGPDEVEPLAGVPAAQVVKIELEKQGKSLSLEKTEGVWRLTAPLSDLADSNSVNDLLNGLLQLSLGSQAASDPSSYPTYELNDSSAAHVRVFTQGSAAASFDGYFGKRAIGYDSLYFRRAGEKPVLIASGLSSYQLERTAEDFRERALSRIDRDALVSAALTVGGKSFEIRKDSASWTASGADLERDRLEPIVTALLNLRITRFPPADFDPKPCAFDKPRLSVELRGAAGKSSFQVGRGSDPKAKKPDHLCVRAEGREAVGEISAAEVASLLDLAKVK